MSVTAQAGRHAAAARAHVLVDRAGRHNYRREECVTGTTHRDEVCNTHVIQPRSEFEFPPVTGGSVRLLLVGDSNDLTEYTQRFSELFTVKIKRFFDLQKNNNYKLNSSRLQYKQYCRQHRLHKRTALSFSVWWQISSPVSWQFFSSSPILQSSWPSHIHFIEMHRLL